MAAGRPFIWDDSRRLTGISLLGDRPCAVVEVVIEPARADEAIAAWRDAATRMLDAVGWGSETTLVRRFAGGASLALTAPVDALFAATLVNEWACEATSALLDGEADLALEEAAAAIRTEIAAERNPAMMALRDEAERRGVTFIHGDDLVSVGLGSGALVWPERELPAADVVDWSAVRDIPVVMVTGTNGKSTTVRLIAAMAEASGSTTGLCTSDWVRVGGEIVERGDFSGPSGARLALRHPRADLAVLELARGGILRRGLPISRAKVCVITNVADDHLGEYGIHDVDALAATKFLVAKAVGPEGRLILNGDDPRLRGRGRSAATPVTWFTLEAGGIALADESEVLFVENERIVMRTGAAEEMVAEIAEIRVAFGGAAKHNVANAMAAIAAARALGIGVLAMRGALASFGSDIEDNPGRGVLREVGGVHVLVDFAHNPHGVAALADIARSIPAVRRLVLVGQAGDRTDDDIRAIAAAVWALDPDRVVVKEMEHYLRGREPGAIPALIRAELTRLGADESAVVDAPSEIAGVRAAFAWAEPGDLLVLLSHEARDETLALIRRLEAEDWSAGMLVE